MATRLGIYNAALAELGARELVSLHDPVESRRVLDRLWNDNLPKKCLEQGVWNFAIKTVKATDDPPAPAFGYLYRVKKPSDWVKTVKISSQPTFVPLLDHFTDEGSYWYVDYDEIYIQFVSSHPTYGGNLDIWPESFTTYVALRLAVSAAPRLLTSPEAKSVLNGDSGLVARAHDALRDAKSKDATNQPPEFPPLGTWVQSRAGFKDPTQK